MANAKTTVTPTANAIFLNVTILRMSSTSGLTKPSRLGTGNGHPDGGDRTPGAKLSELFERIEHLDARPPKVPFVTRGDREPVPSSGRGDIAVF